MTAKPKIAKPSVQPQKDNADAPSTPPPSYEDREIRKAALRFAIDSGAKTTDIVPVAAKIEEFICNGQAKA